jgi:hypothetical protein
VSPTPSPSLENLNDLTEQLAALPPDELDAYLAELSILAEFGPRDEVLRRVWNDPYEFGRVFLRHMMTDPKTGYEFPPCEFHKELYALSRDVILKRGEFRGKRGLVAAAPRGFGKSTIISLIIVIWALCCEHKQFIVIFANTDDQAELLGTNIKREFEENEVLRCYFGDMMGLQRKLKWTLRDFVIVKQNGFVGRVKVRGTGASVRGIRDKNVRPDLVIGDDLENDEDVLNEDTRNKLYQNWWSGAILNMLDPIHGAVLVVGTILHFDSLLSRLLKLGGPGGSYVTRKWTCYDEDGNSAWEERFSTAALHAAQRENPVSFAKEMLNDPREESTRVFRPENVRFYTQDEVEYDGYGTWYFRGKPLDIYCAVDPAIDEEDEACLFALVTAGVTADRKDIIILKVLLDRLDFPSQVDACIAEAEIFRPRLFGFETAAYQRALSQQTKHELREKLRVRELKHGGSKNNKRRRIISLAPLVAGGHVWFRAAGDDEDGEWDELRRVRVHRNQALLYQQLMEFPFSQFQDGVDALSALLETVGGQLFFERSPYGDDLPGKPVTTIADLQRPVYQQILERVGT